MPVYEYEHKKEPCSKGKVFEIQQSLNEAPLKRCPQCRGTVRKLISRTAGKAPKSDRELRDLGFTKLVRRDDGVYENVTAREGENRVVERGKPETLPDLSRTIRD